MQIIIVEITEPDNLRSRHDEDDTLIAFNAKHVREGSILIRSTDTDDLVILPGVAGRTRGSNIKLEYHHLRVWIRKSLTIHCCVVDCYHSEREGGWTDGSTTSFKFHLWDRLLPLA